MFKTVLVLLFLVAAVFAEEAYFAFVTQGTKKEFIFKLTNDLRIKEAREMLEGSSDLRVVIGKIDDTPAPYNPKYSFHLEPESIMFSVSAIEVCDASLPYLEDHIDEIGSAFLPGKIYCPWTTQLTREVKLKYYWKK